MSDPVPLHLHHLISRKHGQSIIEFALILPVLALILLGILDLSRAYQIYVIVANSAREGARWGATHPTDNAGIVTRATTEANGTGVTINVSGPVCYPYAGGSSVPCSTAYNGDQIKVTTRATFQFATLYLFRLPSIQISNSATMAIISGGQTQ